MANRATRILAPLLIIAASAGVYALLHAMKPEPQKSDEKPRPVSVHTAVVQRGDTTLQVVTQGEVRAQIQIDVVAQVGGRVASVSREFTEGGRVEPGVALLQIEDTDYRLALRQAEAQLAEAAVQLEQAEADADVARKQLRDTPNPSDLALKKPQVAQARARLDAARANREQARLNLQRTRISLPFAGRLLSTRVDVGQSIRPGAVVATAFGTDVVEIRLPFDNSQQAALGLPIGYAAAEGGGLPVQLSASVAGRSHHWQGLLVRLDAAIDPATRTLYGNVQVSNPYTLNVSDHGMPLAVGLFVEADIAGRQLPDALIIPRDALRAGDTVYRIDQDGRLDIRPVQVAHSSPSRAIISSGLQAGDRVIVSPIRNPIAGMALLAIDSAPQTAIN